MSSMLKVTDEALEQFRAVLNQEKEGVNIRVFASGMG